jgi:plasmid rolling circle replication initiator protein Rep
MDEKEKPGCADSLARETQPGLDEAGAFSGRLERYAEAKHRALNMVDYIKSDVPVNDESSKVLFALETCGSYLVFRDYYTVGKIRLSGMCSCKKHLICPLCAIRRGAKSVKAYLEKLQVIQQDHPGIEAYLVTLTVKDGPDLAERFAHLVKAMKRYQQQRRNGLKGQKTVEINKALGAVWSYEVKKGKNSGLWHPHLHAVWLCYEEPRLKDLKEEWQEVTGDSFIVDIRPFHDQENVATGFLEVFKYAVKFSDMLPADTWHAFETLKGHRLVASFGLFRGVKVPDTMTDDDLPEDLPYIEMLYRFTRGRGYNLSQVGTPDAPDVVND